MPEINESLCSIIHILALEYRVYDEALMSLK